MKENTKKQTRKNKNEKERKGKKYLKKERIERQQLPLSFLHLSSFFSFLFFFASSKNEYETEYK